ncbi:ABC transporter ATP-binding protein [Lactobacillus sp. CC-MHH1034]|uniref:ABC transporter ATP-binding protein n=1 Tax=Agrilactobacillus fermenti TaxID=2586909 RepID=UPI001E28FCC7|nr:ABC transporter ATP-binding protein [Agrilactobacillus fermenti]MCD2256629.1 ABC transporter ATP-binding protein [Agrilactobacillus fermenti]
MGIFLAAIGTICSLAITNQIRLLIDTSVKSNRYGETIVILVCLFVFNLILEVPANFLLGYVASDAVLNLRKQLWHLITTLPRHFFKQNESGVIASRVLNDTQTIYSLIASALPQNLTGLISLVGAFAMMLILNWRLTLIVLAIVPLLALVVVPLSQKLSVISRLLQAALAETINKVSQMSINDNLIKSFNREKFSQKMGYRGMQTLFGLNVRQLRVLSILNPLVSVLLLLIVFVIILYGRYSINQGQLTGGGLTAYFIYMVQMITPMTSLFSFFTSLKTVSGATDRIQNILMEQPENKNLNGIAVSRIQRIDFEHVSFKYPNSEQLILKDVSFTIRAGEKTALIGESGSGKSTILALMEGFYLPTSGQIRVNGIPIQRLNLVELREKLGYASQDIRMVPGSIRDNLSLGDQKVTDLQLWHALQVVKLDTLVRSLPQQLDTDLGEQGTLFSGGQIQRLSFARVLIKFPDFLLLDEMTSSLDPNNVQEFMTTLDILNQQYDISVLNATHNMRTIEGYPHVIQVINGQVKQFFKRI